MWNNRSIFVRYPSPILLPFDKMQSCIWLVDPNSNSYGICIYWMPLKLNLKYFVKINRRVLSKTILWEKTGPKILLKQATYIWVIRYNQSLTIPSISNGSLHQKRYFYRLGEFNSAQWTVCLSTTNKKSRLKGISYHSGTLFHQPLGCLIFNLSKFESKFPFLS